MEQVVEWDIGGEVTVIQGKRSRERKVLEDKGELMTNVQRKKKKTRTISTLDSSGSEFKCDKCGASSFLQTNKTVKRQRYFYEEASRKKLRLCNACGLKLKRKQSQKSHMKKPLLRLSEDSASKCEYLAQGVRFGSELAVLVGDETVSKFYCPKYRGYQGCGCLQTFIQNTGSIVDQTEIVKRANLLVRYHRRAEELMKGEAGNKDREEFVLTHRDYLKSQLRLCEPAVQRILLYSNNFLYKSSPGRKQRVTPQTLGSRQVETVAASQVLEQHSATCRCDTGTGLEQVQVEEWRDKAQTGQAGRRQVVEEMWRCLGDTLCKGLVHLITGAGMSAIARQLADLRRREESEDHPSGE